MKTRSLIHIQQVCIHCSVDASFIHSLHELGHIEVIVENDDHYITEEQLKALESMIYFHTELHINIEGVDAIAHLLKKIETLQDELTVTKNRLKAYLNE